MELEASVKIDDWQLKIEQAARDLKKDGFAVLCGVYSREKCDLVYGQIWDCLAKASDGKLKRGADYKKMKATELPQHSHGILGSERVNHMPPVREMRRDPEIFRYFAALLGTDQLVGSMDRLNLKFPGRSYKSKEPWPHVDQDPRLIGRVTIQSYMTLTDCSENEGGNRLYKGSHLLFGERFAYRRKGGKLDNWCRLSQEEAAELGKLCPLTKPVLSKGDMLLWDSRTAHSPSDGSDFTNGRCVVYLCYNKLWQAANDKEFLEEKKQAFLDCKATTHSPVPQKFFEPRVYDPNKKAAFSEFSKEQLGISDTPQGAEKYLFGFDSYKGREGLLLGEDWKKTWSDERTPMPLLEFVSPFTTLLPAVRKTRQTGLPAECSHVKKKQKTG